ncbi:hypothetical protein L1887_27706 [Cichorium endivia]|nr:hypothetical protein L1887_27706 [Cichorium endivia]
MFLSQGIFINQGKTWFWLNEKGEHCEMISAAECFYPITDIESVPYEFYAKEKSRFADYINTQICSDFKIHIKDKEWFSLDKNGKKCLMLPAAVALEKHRWSWRSLPESRFEEVAFDPIWSFTISCSTSNMLSAKTCYGAYLVYKLQENHSGFEPPLKVWMTSHFTESISISRYIYFLSPQTPVIRRKIIEKTYNPLNRPKIKGISQQRKDGWMEVQIDEQHRDVPLSFVELSVNFPIDQSLKGLIVQGIEFRPCN